jgi:hypothetical protein
MLTRPTYQIRVNGQLDPQWADWFGGMTIVCEAQGETVLTGPVANQATLFGLLARVRDLGLTLLAVNRVEESDEDVTVKEKHQG